MFVIYSGFSYAQQLPKQSQKYMEMNALLVAEQDKFNDIAYLYMAPQFEENPDPKRAVTIELYFGEYDGSEASIRRLNLIKEIIHEEQRLNKDFHTQVVAMAPAAIDLQDDNDLNDVLDQLKIKNSSLSFEVLPAASSLISNKKNGEKNADRTPSGFNPGAKFWTFMRFSSATGVTFAGLMFAGGVPAHIAASAAIIPGLASGALTYYSGGFGRWLTNGSYAKWLVESDTWFAKGLRKTMGLNPKNFQKELIKKRNSFRKKYPSAYAKNPGYFIDQAKEMAGQKVSARKLKLKGMLAKLGNIDAFVKQWVSEAGFISLSLKAPQAVLGIVPIGAIGHAVGDIAIGTTYGMLAQGAGDIAIHKRKFQKVEELRQNVLSGKVTVDNKTRLLSEIDDFFDEKVRTNITKNSHKALRRIENWAKSRVTLLSAFTIFGVGMEMVGVPLAKPVLIATGIGGAVYYANVSGWISKEKMKNYFKNMGKKAKTYFNKLKSGNIKIGLKPFTYRFCATKFRIPAR